MYTTAILVVPCLVKCILFVYIICTHLLLCVVMCYTFMGLVDTYMLFLCVNMSQIVDTIHKLGYVYIFIFWESTIHIL